MTFEEFAAARLGAVVRFAAVLAGERALAEDIVQEVLIRAHARWNQIGRLDRPEAYVRKMIVNEYLSWRRRSWRLVSSAGLEAGQDRPGRDHAADHAERDALLAEVGRSPASAAVKLTEDKGVEAVTPPRGVNTLRGQVTMVCFLGSGQTGCGYGNRNTLPGTWSRFTATVGIGSDISPGAIFGPSTLAHDISAGAWQVVGRTQLDGQQAIELNETDRGDNNTALEPLPVRLWVNAQTYLPIRLAMGTRDGSTPMGFVDFRYLPPTPANLVLLQVPIPVGYPRR
jgi:hypothetical protein